MNNESLFAALSQNTALSISGSLNKVCVNAVMAEWSVRFNIVRNNAIINQNSLAESLERLYPGTSYYDGLFTEMVKRIFGHKVNDAGYPNRLPETIGDLFTPNRFKFQMFLLKHTPSRENTCSFKDACERLTEYAKDRLEILIDQAVEASDTTKVSELIGLIKHLYKPDNMTPETWGNLIFVPIFKLVECKA